ncbi:hypothetical protein SS50377_26338 [Spironucleus salmonicida]|uniref:Uncharacterized protein n=1 Tax=Spironucleus salmonicida TaxID=348837 RepID=A0A9P8LPK2_9EUKA|nr:hypothetical protein SS50377_26338 [Spironucleus salmonicida]
MRDQFSTAKSYACNTAISRHYRRRPLPPPEVQAFGGHRPAPSFDRQTDRSFHVCFVPHRGMGRQLQCAWGQTEPFRPFTQDARHRGGFLGEGFEFVE